MENLKNFISQNYNVVLVAPIFSFIVAQALKYIIYAIQYKVFRKERLTGAGGMPSSHSSGVCTLAVIAARIEGVTSPLFAVSMILALIVMYDAAGVRMAAGLHAKEINRLRKSIKKLEEAVKPAEANASGEAPNINAASAVNEASRKAEKKAKKEAKKAAKKDALKELKEFLGHTHLEVLCGAILGIIIGIAFKI